MPRPRKMIRLRELVEWVNERNATSTCDPAVREGWNSLVNHVLMQADAYAGFGCLGANDLQGDAKGHPPGIIFDHSGEHRHEFPDETRIRFFVPRGL